MFQSKTTQTPGSILGSSPADKDFFTSDLSTKEFALIEDAGFEPLGLVMGSSIYHIGFQRPKLTQSAELETLTQAMYQARILATERMEAEAAALGADGVVGVKLTIGMQQWGENLAEFLTVGTAVKATTTGSVPSDGRKPFTSDLSGQDFWVLIKSGYRPVSFVMGNCVYHVGYQGIKGAFATAFQNVEMPTYARAIYEARELAMSRMRSEGKGNGSKGIIGVSVTQSCYSWDTHIIEFFAVGTSIAKFGERQLPTPTAVMPFIDPS